MLDLRQGPLLVRSLDSADRLTQPMLKQGGEWKEVDWQTALEYVAHGLKNIKHEHGADAIAALATPHSTLEELHLLQKLTRGLGSDNVDFRLRQATSLAGRQAMAGHVDHRIPAEPRLRDRFLPAQGSPAAGDPPAPPSRAAPSCRSCTQPTTTC
jgi:hypothetical protein